MKRAKRVSFKDHVPDRSKSGRLESTSAPLNDTKTSEFAFFKKFREDASIKHQSRSPHGGKIQFKCSTRKTQGGDECSTATIHSREQGNKNFVSSSQINANGRNAQEEDLELSCLIKTPTSRGHDDFFVETAAETVRSDTRCMDGDIFTKKRAKLQSWVAKTMCPGNGEIIMGCELISLLLKRVLPESFERNHSENTPKSMPDSEEIEHESVYMPKSGYQFNESWTERKLVKHEYPCFMDSWTERKLVKHEYPCFMDAGASSSWSSKYHGSSFLLERPVGSACFPTLECADQMILGHQDKEIEPYFFSNIDYEQSWNNNSAETFVEATTKSYGTYETFNPSRLTLGSGSVKEHFLNDKPSSSWYYRLDNIHSAQKESLFNSESSTPSMRNCDNSFLLQYEMREPECIASTDTGSMFYNSPEKCRSSALINLIGTDQSTDDLEHLSCRRKPSGPHRSFLLNADCSTSRTNSYGNRFLLEYEKREPKCIANIETGSMFGNSPGKYSASALTTFMASDQLNADVEHSSFIRKPSHLLLGWDIDRVKDTEIRPSFLSTDLMHIQQCPEITTVASGLYSLPYLPISSADAAFYPDDALQEFDTSHQRLYPHRSYFHEPKTRVTTHVSPFLLLEGSEDDNLIQEY